MHLETFGTSGDGVKMSAMFGQGLQPRQAPASVLTPAFAMDNCDVIGPSAVGSLVTKEPDPGTGTEPDAGKCK